MIHLLYLTLKVKEVHEPKTKAITTTDSLLTEGVQYRGKFYCLHFSLGSLLNGPRIDS